MAPTAERGGREGTLWCLISLATASSFSDDRANRATAKFSFANLDVYKIDLDGKM